MKRMFKWIIVTLLTWEAKRVLRHFHPRIIVVAGSVGKTSTKDAIAHVLSQSQVVGKSQKSFNSEVGIPLTILGLDNAWGSPLGWISNLILGWKRVSNPTPFPSVLVLEVGSDQPGDITRLASWLNASVAVLTSLPEVPVHVENFASPDDLRAEDEAVFELLVPEGIAIGCIDDHYVKAALERQATRGRRTLSYGFSGDALVRGLFPQIRYAQNHGTIAPLGMQWQVLYGDENRPAYLDRVLGNPACLAALAAVAVGVSEGMTLAQTIEPLMTLDTPKGRMRMIDGKNGAMIIDDTYNSSPVALERALDTLEHIKGKRKIAVLGDMLELGEWSDAMHAQAGEHAAKVVDVLVTVGVRALKLADRAHKAGLPDDAIRVCTSAQEAGQYISDMMTDGDVVLAKGSQGSGANSIRLERAVLMMMRHKEDAPQLLVRQEEAWKSR
jgi:UDP-N-acetylmuramoyl-tripeptide--D-alanyl-D-alanine ligase